MYNALDQCVLELGSLTVAGFSMAGLATYVQVPELNTVFDLGECPMSAARLDHVILTHAHGDHSRCVLRHYALRAMLGRDAATYYMPAVLVDRFFDLWRADVAFADVPPDESIPPDVIGLDTSTPGTQLAHSKHLVVRAFALEHTVTSYGYTLYERAKKLRPEFRGRSGREIVALKRDGVVVEDDVLRPRISVLGDCTVASVAEHDHIWESPVVVLETTYLRNDDVAFAAPRGHTHLLELRDVLASLPADIACEHLVLRHFSMRYERDVIEERVGDVLAPFTQAEVHLLA